MKSSNTVLNEGAKQLQAINNPKRLEAVRLLQERTEMSGAELRKTLGMNQPNFWIQIGMLVRAGIVSASKSGRDVTYRLNEGVLNGTLRLAGELVAIRRPSGGPVEESAK